MKFNFVYIKNDVFKAVEKCSDTIDIEITSENENAMGLDFLNLLRCHKKDIVEKKFDNISSFNFSRDVFNKRNWNELSKIARGLFVDTNNGNIVARGFDKFFNYCEGFFNTDAWLKTNLKFPVVVYKKYNGFLGILTFDRTEHKFLFCSKSCVSGTFSDYFKSIFNELKKDEESSYFTNLANHLVNNNSCLIFEVIDPFNDPHIVEYDKSDIVLLDEVKLNQKFEHSSYEELCKIGQEFKFKVKEKIMSFDDWDSLKSFINKALDYSFTKNEEGWVFEDANDYHFKLKCGWYKFWKDMRHYKQKLTAGHGVSTSGLQTPLMNKVFAWMKSHSREWLQSKSIIDVRNEFEKEKNSENQ